MSPFDFRNIEAPSKAVPVTDLAPARASAAPAPHQSRKVELPDYLRRYYAWAYVWPFSVWFFDHQPIINAILFGNYKKIMRHTMRMMDLPSAGKTIQIAGVYGELTPTLALGVEDLHVIDAAPIQLQAARRKLGEVGRTACLRLMRAEELHYPDGSFDTALMFLLLHELPAKARRESLAEALRVLRPGGRFVIAEYGECRNRHFFHRFWPMRWILTKAEPFLDGFWNESLTGVLKECGESVDRHVELEEEVKVFGGFYRVARYRVT